MVVSINSDFMLGNWWQNPLTMKPSRWFITYKLYSLFCPTCANVLVAFVYHSSLYRIHYCIVSCGVWKVCSSVYKFVCKGTTKILYNKYNSLNIKELNLQNTFWAYLWNLLVDFNTIFNGSSDKSVDTYD